MEMMEKGQNPYLTTIVKDKRRFYPKFEDKILEFSIFDLTTKKNKFFIGIKVLGSRDTLTMINIKNVNLSYGQRITIRDAFKAKQIGVKDSDFE